jgi:hypothetical protein
VKFLTTKFSHFFADYRLLISFILVGAVVTNIAKLDHWFVGTIALSLFWMAIIVGLLLLIVVTVVVVFVLEWIHRVLMAI